MWTALASGSRVKNRPNNLTAAGPDQGREKGVQIPSHLYIYKEGELVGWLVGCRGRLLSRLWANLAETLVDGRVGHGYHYHQVVP